LVKASSLIQKLYNTFIHSHSTEKISKILLLIRTWRNHGIFFKTNICKCFVQIWTHEWTLIQSVFCDCLLVKYLNCTILLSVEKLIWSQFYLTPSFSKILICLLCVLLCVSIISDSHRRQIVLMFTHVFIFVQNIYIYSFWKKYHDFVPSIFFQNKSLVTYMLMIYH
jgi:hypothetical protein